MTTDCCIPDDDGPMTLDCCGLNTSVVSKEQQNKKDDDTDLEVSLDSSNSDNCSGREGICGEDDDASVAASVVSAVSDLVTGQLALELGAEMVRSASEVLFGQCQHEMQILQDIELDGASETSSLYTDDSNDVDDLSLTGFVRIRRSFGRSKSSTASRRKQHVVEQIEEEEAETPKTSITKEAEKYANALTALQRKQAEALEEHHRLKEEERSVCAAPTPIFPRKPSVAEQVLFEAYEEDISAEIPSDESSTSGMFASKKNPNQNDGFSEPMVVHKIHPQGSTYAQDMSVTDVLPSDFVPFWTEEPSTSSPSTTPEEYASACLKILEDKEESKPQRTKKLSKIVPSFLRKRSMMGKKKN